MNETIVPVAVGETVSACLPWSDVCCRMRVTAHGAQILNPDGSPFSFSITHVEAGIYTDHSTGTLYIVRR